MSESTPNLSLPLIMASQAQKHITHNEALTVLDMLCQLTAKTEGTNTPPTDPEDGDVHLLGSAPTGDWDGQANTVASYDGSGWRFVAAKTGWRAFVESYGGRLMYFDGTEWVALEGTSAGGGGGFDGEVEAIGIGTAVDSTNPLSAKLNTALFTALPTTESGNGSMSVTLNKDADGTDLGLLFQNNAQTVAQLGLFGSDDMTLQVSSDGITYHTAYTVAPSNGILCQPNLPRFKGVTNYDNLLTQNTWTKIDINQVVFNAQGAFDTSTCVFTAPVDGAYALGAKLMFKTNGSTSVRMQGRFVLNGTTEIEASFCENSTQPVDGRSTLDLNNLVELSAGDTVELQGKFFGYSSAYYAADSTGFWGHLVG